MANGEEPGQVALRLLRALDKNHFHSGDRPYSEVTATPTNQDAIGATPTKWDAIDAGLEFGSYDYDKALDWLLHTDALIPDDRNRRRFIRRGEQSERIDAFKLTPTGWQMLHQRTSPQE